MGIFDVFFGNKDEKQPARKADSPLIIHYPMQENDHKKAAFQNVVVAVKADAAFAESQKERLEKWGAHNGLLAEEIQIVWYQADKLGFVAHDKQGWNHLDIKMMADYALQAKKVYAKALQFAESVGVQEFMFAQLFPADKEGEELQKIQSENLAAYHIIKNEIAEAGIEDKALAKVLREVKQNKDFSINYSQNLAIYRLLWIVFLHDAWLNKDLINSLTGICMSIESGRESMEAIWEMLRNTESNSGRERVEVLNKSETELRNELELFWK